MASTRFTAAASSLDGQAVDERHLGADEQLVGAEVLGAQVDQPLDLGLRLDRRRGSRSCTFGSAVSPMSRLFISMARMTAMTVSRMPISSVPMPS